jgi:hypothetical protein
MKIVRIYLSKDDWQRAARKKTTRNLQEAGGGGRNQGILSSSEILFYPKTLPSPSDISAPHSGRPLTTLPLQIEP